MRATTPTRPWLLLPGAAAAVFALLAIALPVGSNGLGRNITEAPGLAPSLARWATDIHDGFWSRRGEGDGWTGWWLTEATLGDRLRARELCRRGEAEAAMALYERIGVATSDFDALNDLFQVLLLNGDYSRCEWFVRDADRLIGSGVFRNNLAWHYTQTDQRPAEALVLAEESVAAEPTACAIDTLAWAYFANDDVDRAIRTAHETLTYASDGLWFDRQTEQAVASSERLLKRIEYHSGQTLDTAPKPWHTSGIETFLPGLPGEALRSGR